MSVKMIIADVRIPTRPVTVHWPCLHVISSGPNITQKTGLLLSPCFSNFLTRTTFVLESLLEAKNPGQDAFLGILSLALEITLEITAYLIIVWFVFTNNDFFGEFVFQNIPIRAFFYAKT